METKRKRIFRRRVFEAVIIAFCTAVAVLSAYTLLFAYTPNKNALGALGSVAMDVICMIVIIMLIANLMIEKSHLHRTTRLFMVLMVATLYALFFDFLVWAFDGSLAYRDITYLYIVLSLFMGAILAGIFVLYLGSYFVGMYGITAITVRVRICFACNLAAFVLTVVLAAIQQAFDIVDGHYVTGELYDYITVIPILTLIYITFYLIRNVKIIAVHDVIAVTGYIVTMICGALIEATYGIGTTYVSVTVANILIFVMLQNKLIDRERRQKEILSEQMASQFQVLESMAGIYSFVNYVDLEGSTANRFDVSNPVKEQLDLKSDPHTSLNKSLFEGVDEEQKDKFWEFTDLTTLDARMKNEKTVTLEFHHKDEGWVRALYIRIGDLTDEPIKRVIYAIRNIDEEKKNVEKWIKKSNTDELTGAFNRHAYEDEISLIETDGMKDNFVYVSFDVNSLKLANDMLGHEAGDELLIGAFECMKRAFGAYGKLFRTGGDEFVALIFADKDKLEAIKKDFREEISLWSGKFNKNLTISCGYVAKREVQNMTLHQIAVLADKRMYEEKTSYYQKKGIDRRGQRDAHVALCALYTKILKINVTEDTYQIVNMSDEEKAPEYGYSESISEWLVNFGKTGGVHPDDLERYLLQTSTEYLRNYFKEHKDALRIFYRRKDGEDYSDVMMEVIPANDYTDDVQTLFLYVKNL